MAGTVGRNLNLCFIAKIKRPLPSDHHQSPSNVTAPDDHSHPFLFRNYNYLYDPATHESSSSSSSEPDFASIYASQRFFFSSPGSSNSIIESTPCNNTHPPRDQQLLKSRDVKDSTAVSTYSEDPYMDFRRSMQEMVDARDLVDAKADWEYLHELLSCYLSLNPKSTHKFIVGAFADLLVSLLSAEMTEDDGRREEDFSSDGCGIPRQCM
ncbi:TRANSCRIPTION REPRESSOR OFP7-RELATED [Salix viminalis]|uniref:Transcription repressor n=1 Tax=Salix viminalis TaxID=40686 RepID=A0A9Q0UIL2_SALVM|nr:TRANSCRIPTION REPRESSOR OFP7-RELATED [Salix viminalis]